ncbi:homoserine dehydrogenase [Blastopirellula retiformator]|uniref:Homoserine dehydrogenase n=1 Tax=Blastopirellula retiformator TaxID=2527970 RepID=A0A5C5UWY8_9BACT|nr:homoserine dehydrogenase [Blastopirellula retiformator]TWT30894.1 Homoserine dehydrogenase [Blastopirellula retiformator]
MPKTKVAIVGVGTVGAGVARILLDHGDRTAKNAGATLWLEKAVVRDLSRDRDCQLPDGVLTDDLNEIINDPEIKVVAQLMGGVDEARTTMLRLLEAGKDIVTANKALVAEHGPELFSRAHELGRSIAFDAAVAGGIPIITNLTQCLTANQVTSLVGILNGTSNFIVSKMEEDGNDYNDAVREAQVRGYAEADPTMDVDGSDAAQKLAILAHIAFGASIDWKEIPRVGIDSLDPIDLQFAKELGYRVKLLAVARMTDNGLELHVSPTLVKIGRPLAEVRGAYNAIKVTGDQVGDLLYHGLGAGQKPTASSVVADMIDTAVGRTELTFRTLKLFSSHNPDVALCPPADIIGRYYFRFLVDDRPGVMAEIAAILGTHNISIASVIQHAPDVEGDNAVVSLIIMTHTATDGDADAALDEIVRLESVRAGNRKLRVQD